MKALICFSLMCLTVFFRITLAQAVIIDYQYVTSHDYNTMGQAVYNAIGEQTWYFTHASVGGNMVSGLNALHTQDSNKYQLIPQGDNDTPPASVTPGTVYDYNRSNPGWEQKYEIFSETVTNGWGNAVDFTMDKLCYIDQDASATAYFTMMEDLEALYLPSTLVYTTMPLTTSADADNVLRNNYNEAVRAYASANNKLLFDIADLEAYSAAGVEQTFTIGGVTYQRLFSGWTTDGGHLNGDGQEWIAKGWYSLAASQGNPVPEPGTVVLMGLGIGALLTRYRKSRVR